MNGWEKAPPQGAQNESQWKALQSDRQELGILRL